MTYTVRNAEKYIFECNTRISYVRKSKFHLAVMELLMKLKHGINSRSVFTVEEEGLLIRLLILINLGNLHQLHP